MPWITNQLISEYPECVYIMWREEDNRVSFKVGGVFIKGLEYASFKSELLDFLLRTDECIARIEGRKDHGQS